MIRKLTANEKSCNPDCDYLIERHGAIIWLTESQFRKVAFESVSLLDDLLKEKWQEYFEKMKS